MNPETAINEQIRAREVRLVDQDGKQVGIVAIDEALRRAREVGLDLVEVAAEARPPVCRIFDYRKILYEQKRKQKESRKKAHHIDVKEIKVRVTIDTHDLMVKSRRAREFLLAGDKVKLTIQFRGREITKQQLAENVIVKFLSAVSDIAEVSQDLVRQGRQQHMILSQKREAGKKAPDEVRKEPVPIVILGSGNTGARPSAAPAEASSQSLETQD